MNSKERAQLRAAANTIETILQIGKGGIVENVVTQVNDALEARELIKGCVLETGPITAAQAAAELAEKTDSEVVQVIGRRFVLYRKKKDK